MKHDTTKTNPPKANYTAIAGYWLERAGRRVVLYKGQCGAWMTVSRDATPAQVEGVGFNLENRKVREVLGLA
jgi:hypothetical protein